MQDLTIYHVLDVKVTTYNVLDVELETLYDIQSVKLKLLLQLEESIKLSLIFLHVMFLFQVDSIDQCPIDGSK